MKKIIFTLLIFFNFLHAEVIRVYPSQKILQQHIPIVDIRTPEEWRETGLVKGSIPIMFFDHRGNYDIERFLKALHKNVDTSKPFALICHTGQRTAIVSAFLSKEFNYTVIDIAGGIEEAKRRKLPITPYL